MGVYTSTPKTWAVEEELTASDFNAEIRDPIAAMASSFTSYTPTLGGFTVGNGTLTGGYRQVGKAVDFYARLTFGSTTTAASAVPTITLPVTSNGTAGSFHVEFYDASASKYYMAGHRQGSSTTVAVYVLGTAGACDTPSTTSPFTWTTSDQITVWGRYVSA